MRVSELTEREPVFDVLAATLARGWSAQHGSSIDVSAARVPGAQRLRLQPLLSIIVADGVIPRARRWIADSFRYTPRRSRVAAQWVLGSILASAAGLRLTTRDALWVSRALPRAKDLVVLPGNRRVRVFDFGAGMCRVMLKAGFEPAPVLKEVGVRGKGDGPFPRITSWDPAGTWFEEPIIEGFALPRCPPWKDRSAFEQKALRLLASHLKAKVRPRAAVAYAMALSESVQAQALRMDARVAGDLARRLGPVLPVLASEAGLLAEVPLSETHGDFQPGNVLVENGTERVLLTDWEHAEERYAKYDFLVWGLRSRFAAGLSARLQAFLSRGALGPAAAYLPEIENAAWRRRALALFLLEELSWILRDGLSGPRAALSPTAHAIVDFAEARVFRR